MSRVARDVALILIATAAAVRIVGESVPATTTQGTAAKKASAEDQDVNQHVLDEFKTLPVPDQHGPDHQQNEAHAASEGKMNKMEGQILAEYQGVPPETIIRVLGVPQGTSEQGDTKHLTWHSSKQTGVVMYGTGVQESHECRATFKFKQQRLIGVNLVGADGSDRKMCKKLVKPLLRDTTSTEPVAVGLEPSRATHTPSTSDVGEQATPSEILTNDDIIKLAKAGISDVVVINKIKSSTCKFDLSTDGLIKLKAAGVSNVILEAMTRPLAKRE